MLILNDTFNYVTEIHILSLGNEVFHLMNIWKNKDIIYFEFDITSAQDNFYDTLLFGNINNDIVQFLIGKLSYNDFINKSIKAYKICRREQTSDKDYHYYNDNENILNIDESPNLNIYDERCIFYERWVPNCEIKKMCEIIPEYGLLKLFS